MTRDWETTLALVFPVSAPSFTVTSIRGTDPSGARTALYRCEVAAAFRTVERALERGFGSSEFLGDDGVVGMADDEDAAVAHGLGVGSRGEHSGDEQEERERAWHG